MKKVCIYALDDGGFSVELEGEDAGMGGDMGAPVGMPGAELAADAQGAQGAGQAFASVDEALDAARTLLAGDGTDPVGADKPLMEGEADFVAGFKQARGGEGQGF